MLKTKFNDDWKFIKSDIDIAAISLDDAQSISLPHTWNAVDGCDGGNDYHRGVCTYIKDFTIAPNEYERFYIEFEGVNSIANVYLNGHHLGEHRGGYSTFRFDLSKYIKENNQLIVKVDNRYHDDVYPLIADFTFYGGIYRNVSLIYAYKESFSLDDDGSEGIYVSQLKVTKQFADIEIKSIIDHFSIEARIKLDIKIYRGQNMIINERKVLYSDIDTTMIRIDKPRLWDGINDPFLYRMVIRIIKKRQTLDQRIIPIGLRHFVLKDDGFYLNGKKTFLKGVCRHQDRHGFGNALLDKHHIEDIKIMKDIGSNAIRLAHYQQSRKMYELTDKEGFIVWAEIPYITIPSKTDLSGKNAMNQLRELIKQCYNHPSIMFWGIQNEITAKGKRDCLEEVVAKLHYLAKDLDPYRYTIQAHIASQPIKDSLNDISDGLGYNLYHGWYYGEIDGMKEWIDTFRKENATTPLCISEYGVEGIISYHSDKPVVRDYSEEYHAYWHEKIYPYIENSGYLFGSFVWNMFSFGSDHRNEGGVKGLNNKGLVTYDRKIKKDAYFYYKAKWSDESVLHLCSKRFIHRHNPTTTIKVYSNLKEVDLILNGEHIDTLVGTNCTFTKEVTLTEGKNHIIVQSGTLKEEAVFLLQSFKDKSYIVPTEPYQEQIRLLDDHNWIDDQVDTPQDITYFKEYYSNKDKLSDLVENAATKKVLEHYLDRLFSHELYQEFMEYSIEELVQIYINAIPKGMQTKINQALQQIKKG